ncbi:hypothetical protein ABZ942_00950 [Nocardia sp. NPDC046473]|uniref:hypothetical protein n=1 Tax=Nocardia sp. NPDC046473 TaxID=3155733 RepID=UPI0033E57C0A
MAIDLDVLEAPEDVERIVAEMARKSAAKFLRIRDEDMDSLDSEDAAELAEQMTADAGTSSP